MIKYKLTDPEGYTRRGKVGETKWEPGKTLMATGEGNALCTDGVIHFYDDPVLALMVNPVHADIANPQVWGIDVDEIVARDGLKGGCKEARAIRIVATPRITEIQRQAFGILCALEVCSKPAWAQWANNWLSGKDRTTEAAAAAVSVASWASEAAASWAAGAVEIGAAVDRAAAAWAAASAAKVCWMVAQAANVAWMVAQAAEWVAQRAEG